ncbi:exonuclease domain-containing protein [Corynebacterium urinipleomorphum]|uniref:exonuclease domain-containing protein n=1 Tax=Corynebacterium urinipleomorphum TaxID=1852380 RepID=UPI000B35684A|nr:exonuclease domain-containing protein [Corynebacterium urinipleomorphum]
MINAHGSTILVTDTALEIHPDPLEAALTGSSEPAVLALAEVASISVRPGDAWDAACVIVSAGENETVIRFAPGDDKGPEQLRSIVEAARSGKKISTDSIPGFSFVAFDVETANQNWGSICQMGLVRVVDGEITERASWLCRPPAGIDEFDPFNIDCHGITAEAVADQPAVGELFEWFSDFVGDLPIVAHNAYFDASALRYAALASGRDIPKITFGCTLAQSRASNLDVANHRLPTVARYFGVALENHHDAGADAEACAEVMVSLARRAEHTGTLADFVHASGFALGSVGDSRVTPVLKDLSGAQTALQVGQPAETSGEQSGGSGVSGKSGAGRGPAPWQSVATPDTIPEPAVDADPDSPLYEQHVTLTGEFEPFDKGQLWNGIAARGGQVGKNVTKKTTILVVGEWANMTSKEKRARELMDKGQKIEIWPADKFLDVLGLSEQPPF